MAELNAKVLSQQKESLERDISLKQEVEKITAASNATSASIGSLSAQVGQVSVDTAAQIKSLAEEVQRTSSAASAQVLQTSSTLQDMMRGLIAVTEGKVMQLASKQVADITEVRQEIREATEAAEDGDL